MGKSGRITVQCDICREGKLRWYRENKNKYTLSKKEYDKVYYLENKQKIKEQCSKYYIENKLRLRHANELWKINNPDRYKLLYTVWRNSIKGKISKINSNHKRRIRMQFTDIATEWLINLFNNTIKCKICGCIMDNNGEAYPNGKQLDHIIPLNIGGLHVKKNVRIACYKCNISRPKNGNDLVNINYSLDKF